MENELTLTPDRRIGENSFQFNSQGRSFAVGGISCQLNRSGDLLSENPKDVQQNIIQPMKPAIRHPKQSFDQRKAFVAHQIRTKNVIPLNQNFKPSNFQEYTIVEKAPKIKGIFTGKIFEINELEYFELKTLVVNGWSTQKEYNEC